MPVLFDRLIFGEAYDRPELAELWGYEDWHAIGRGIVTPKGDNKVVLFVTKEKQDTLAQYQDHFDGDQLFMDGETNHANDNRLVAADWTPQVTKSIYFIVNAITPRLHTLGVCGCRHMSFARTHPASSSLTPIERMHLPPVHC